MKIENIEKGERLREWEAIVSLKAREKKIKREKEKDYLYQRLRLLILGNIDWVKLSGF